MQSYLTSVQKMAIESGLFDLHATFARPITVYRTAQEAVILTNPENNYLFQDAPFNTQTTKIQQSGICNARILYGKKENITPFNSIGSSSTSQNQIWLQEGEVRIKLDATGKALVDGCERIQFDGTIFNFTTSSRPHGIFDPKFTTYYLKKLN